MVRYSIVLLLDKALLGVLTFWFKCFIDRKLTVTASMKTKNFYCKCLITS